MNEQVTNAQAIDLDAQIERLGRSIGELLAENEQLRGGSPRPHRRCRPGLCPAAGAWAWV